jgi:hypothetical protein
MSGYKKPQFTDLVQVENLRNRCDQISQEIQDGEVHINGEGSQDLKGEYNRLSRQIDDLCCEPTMDPLVVLPPEIWTEILHEAATENGINLSTTEAMLLFTSVTRNWNKMLLDTATLWTDLAIGLGEADAHAKLETGLCLSRDLPLKLIIYLPPCQWDADWLLPHANRIQEIAFLATKRRDVTVNIDGSLIDQILSSLGSLPSLRAFTPLISQLNWDCIFAKSPSIVSIHGTELHPSVIQRAGLLRSCQIQATSSDIISYLEDFALLEDLTWVVEYEENTPIFNTVLPCLPCLREVRVRVFDTPNAKFLAVMKSANNLTYLTLQIDKNWQHLFDLFHIFPCLPRLQRLYLGICPVPGNLVWPAIVTTETNVTDLAITKYRDNTSPENQEVLSAILPLYFPNVTTFRLRYADYTAGVASYIRSAKRLLTLDLGGMILQPGYEGSLESSSLESLAIFGQSDLLSDPVNFTCPLLSNLSLELDGYGQGVHHWTIYGHVEHLYIRSKEYFWEIYKLRALRNIRLGSHHSDYLDSTSNLLMSLILNPMACPLLAEIELEDVPEWDLLFIMLERRNYIPISQGVARIETLILPSPIPPILLSPLTEILAGRFTERPSNRDLSSSALLEVYFDSSM